MLGRTNAAPLRGGYNFTYYANDGQLNGEPITTGQTVQLSAGTWNELHTNSETQNLRTEGHSIPYIIMNPEPSSMRAGGNVWQYLYFVMPAQDATFT